MEKSLTEDQARAYLESPLEYPGLAVKNGAHEVLRLSRQPAFDPEAVWSLYKAGGEYFLRRIVYAVDERSLPWTHNTFAAESVIPAAKAEEILDRLAQISLRPFVQKLTGIDGCIHAVRVGHGWHKKGMDGGVTELSWWDKTPENWLPLRNWYGETILAFEAQLAASTVPIQDKHPWVE